jgi:murein L,D-transpeptidase YcbB/YkuD
VVVNLGQQLLHVFEEGQVRLSMPVVVGMPERPTPLLSDRIVDLKFSPDWIVPPVIAREDILPILQARPAVLADMGIDILDAENRSVVPTSVAWAEVDPFNIPFRFRMKPGLDNLLGGVRFSLTNDLAIYLHDSPERDRYSPGVRSFSSGCVRVGDAVALASWIMGDQKNWTRAQVIAAMVKGETRIERLAEPIRVDFIYSTVGLDAQGGLVFKPDIYGDDARLARELGLEPPGDVPPPLPKSRLSDPD